MLVQSQKVKDVGAVGAKHISSDLAELNRRKLASSTRRRKCIVTGTLFSCLVIANDSMSATPAFHVKPPLSQQKETRHLSLDDVHKPLAVVHKPRDRAIIQLFLQAGLRLSSRQIQRMVHHYMKEANIKNASVHSLRYTVATPMLDDGASRKGVSAALGHSSTDMTAQIYQHEERRRRAEVLTRHAVK